MEMCDNVKLVEKLFYSLDETTIVFFEDDFRCNKTKGAIVSSLIRQSKRAQEKMLIEIKRESSEFSKELEGLLKVVNDNKTVLEEEKDNWVLYDFGDTLEAIGDKARKIKAAYDRFEITHMTDIIYDIMCFYGIGIEYPRFFKDLFDGHIFKDFEYKEYRVFRDFSASDQGRLEAFLNDSGSALLLCIVDNQLNEQKRANEINEVLGKAVSGIGAQIIGCILSSTTDMDSITPSIYLECVNKVQLQKVVPAIARSAYSYVLRKLQSVYKKELENAFSNAIKNKNISYYLAKMAATEGISNYQVVSEWIKLLFDYKVSEDPNIYEMVRITKLIDLLEDDTVAITDEMRKLNTFEAFDLKVNNYNEPIAAGDIFAIYDESGIIKNRFMLVGQDCDMMYSPSRPIRNGISELVSIEPQEQIGIGNEVKENLESIRIANFRESPDEYARTLKIKYKSREFIDNQILQLCQFNRDGGSYIKLEGLLEDQYRIMPDYYPDLYKDAQEFFRAIKMLHENQESNLEVVLRHKQSPRILCLSDYKIQDGVIKYPLKRLCRLKNQYTLFAYKTYLDYRGRHPFATINMARNQDLSLTIDGHPDVRLNACLVLSPDRELNRSDIRKLEWVLDAREVREFAARVFNQKVCFKEEREYIILDEKEAPYKNSVKLNDDRDMVFTKLKKRKVKIELTEAPIT